MSIRPILFNAEMVKAILDDRKTVTRRVVKPHNHKKAKLCEYAQGNGLWIDDGYIKDYSVSSCWMKIEDYIDKYYIYKPGDILWVRETWHKDAGRYMYKADYADAEQFFCGDKEVKIRWSPSIHFPKAAARLFLQVKSVRVERLQAITEDGAEAEGVPCEFPMEEVYCPVCNGDGLIGMYNSGSLGYAEIECPHCEKATTRFENLWNSAIKPADLPRHGWDANPFVWVVEFEPCERPEDFLKEDADHDR